MKRMMSKTVLSALIAAAPAWLLAGCSSSDGRTDRMETNRQYTNRQNTDYYVTRPAPQVQGTVVRNSGRPADTSLAGQLPSGATHGIRTTNPDAVILDVERGSADEWIVYAQTEGQIREFHVRSSDGLVLLSDQAMTNQAAIDNLPPSVRQAVTNAHPGGIIYAADQLNESGGPAWRVRVLANGNQYFVDAADTGQLINSGPISTVAGTQVQNTQYSGSPQSGNWNQSATWNQQQNTSGMQYDNGRMGHYGDDHDDDDDHHDDHDDDDHNDDRDDG